MQRKTNGTTRSHLIYGKQACFNVVLPYRQMFVNLYDITHTMLAHIELVFVYVCKYNVSSL